MSANDWGCESTGSTSKYVKSIQTDANGIVTVKAQGIGDANIDDKDVTLIPADASGASVTYAPGVAINRWICGGTGTTVLAKFLPGSCRG